MYVCMYVCMHYRITLVKLRSFCNDRFDFAVDRIDLLFDQGHLKRMSKDPVQIQPLPTIIRPRK